MMRDLRRFAALDFPLLVLLATMPIATWLAVAWDAFQPPREVQSFLGGSQNIYLLLILPLAAVTLPRILLARAIQGGPHALFARLALAVLGWALLGLTWNGHFSTLAGSIVPLTAILAANAGLLAFISAREARAQGQGPLLMSALTLALVATGLGGMAGGIVHLLGPLPSGQPFLFVDGFANVRTLGEVMMLAVGASLVWMWGRPGLVPFLLAVVLASVLAWTGTRAAWMGLAGALLLGLAWWRPGWKAAGLTVGALILGAGLSLALPVPHGTYGIGRLAYLASETAVALETGLVAENEAGAIEGSDRLKLWSWGVAQISNHPWLGHGYGTMGVLDRPDYANFKHLHNLPLDLAFGLGIPMAVVLTLLLLAGVLGTFERARHDRLMLFPLAAGAVLGTSLFAGVFLFPFMTVVAGLGLSGAGLRQADPRAAKV